MTLIEYAKKYAPNVIGDTGYASVCPYMISECFKPYAKNCNSMDCCDCLNQKIDIDALNCALSFIGIKNTNIAEPCKITSGKDYIALYHYNEPITIKKSAITSVGKYENKTVITYGSSSVTVDENYNDVVNAVFDD